MPLQVIGSGFGRTGTKSLKAALERLGFGPCHHMHEVVTRPETVPLWVDAFAQGTADWEHVFDGFSAQVDWPGAHFWRELAETFPDSKVIHSVRPEEKWWASYEKTIGKLGSTYRDMPVPLHVRDILDATFGAVRQTFGGDALNRDGALAAYRRRTAEVTQALPPDRVLVFDVAEGWGPLCRFLGTEVPDEPFPHHNLRADFWEVLGGEPPDRAMA